jgi:hypothetical protein
MPKRKSKKSIPKRKSRKSKKSMPKRKSKKSMPKRKSKKSKKSMPKRKSKKSKKSMPKRKSKKSKKSKKSIPKRKSKKSKKSMPKRKSRKSKKSIPKRKSRKIKQKGGFAQLLAKALSNPALLKTASGVLNNPQAMQMLTSGNVKNMMRDPNMQHMAGQFLDQYANQMQESPPHRAYQDAQLNRIFSSIN